MVEQKEIALDDIFQALSDPTRRSMLGRLALQERTITELAAPFDMSLAAASKHIKVLEKAGLVFRTKTGRTHVCRLNPRPLVDARAWLRYYEQFWNARLDTLEQVLQEADQPHGANSDE